MFSSVVRYARARAKERDLNFLQRRGKHRQLLAQLAEWKDPPSTRMLQRGAVSAHEVGDYPLARQYALEALRRSPGHQYTARILILTLRQMGMQAEGIEFGEDWVRLHRWRAVQIHKDIALLKGDLGRNEEALAHAREAFRRKSSDSRIACIYIYYVSVVKGPKAARRALRRWCLLHHADTFFLCQVARGFSEAGDLDEALKRLRKARRIRWTADVARTEVQVLLRHGDPQAAIEAGDAWLASPRASRSGAAEFWLEMATACRKAGLDERALDCHRNAHNADADDPNHLNACMAALASAGRATEALELGEAWLLQHEGSITAIIHNRMGIVLHHAGRLAEAATAYARAGAVDPHNPVFPLNRLQATIDAGNHAASLALTESLRESLKGEPRYWDLLGRLHRERGDGEAELACAMGKLALAPHDPKFAIDVFAVHGAHGDVAAAHAFFEEWTNAHGRHPLVLNEMGHVLANEGDIVGAVAHYREASAGMPVDSVLAANLVWALVQSGEVAEARAIGEAWLDGDHEPSPYFLTKLGMACHHARHDAEALAHLDKALALNPDYEEAVLWKLASLDALDRADDVERFMSAWSAEHTMTARLWNNWANHVRHHGGIERAIGFYRSAVSLSPTPVHISNLVRTLDAAGKTDEGVDAANAWIRRHGAHGHLCYHLGRILLERGRHAEALEAFEQGLHSATGDDDILVDNIVASLRLLDREAEALARAEAWIVDHEPTAFLLTEMGICHGTLDHTAAAEDCFARALEVEPGRESTFFFMLDHLLRRDPMAADAAARKWIDAGHPLSPRVLNLAGIAAERAGDPLRATGRYEKALEAEPDNAIFAGNLLSVLLTRGERREAYRRSQPLLTLHPANARLLNLSGVAAFETGRLEESVRHYQTALQHDPRNPYICGNLMQALHELKEFLEAIRSGEHWRAKPENQPNAYFLRWLALNHYGLNRRDQAMAILRLCEPADREYGQAMRTLASLLNHDGRHAESLDLLNSLPQGTVDPAGTHYEYSRAYRELGMVDAAIENARKAVELSPGDLDCATLYLRTLRTAQEFDTADEFASQWTRAHGERAEILTYQGCVAHDRGDFPRAESITRRAMMADPGFEPAARYLVKSLMALGRTREARMTAEGWQQENKPSPEISRLLDELRELPEA